MSEIMPTLSRNPVISGLRIRLMVSALSLMLFVATGTAMGQPQNTRGGPVLGDLFSDRAVLVSGWSSEELAKILDTFASKYKNALPNFRTVIFASGGRFRVALPDDFSPDLLSFLVNYIHYPEGLDPGGREIAALGLATVTKQFDAPASELGKKAEIYVPADDDEYDLVYIRVGEHTYSQSFTTMQWTRVEAPRLSEATRALVP